MIAFTRSLRLRRTPAPDILDIKRSGRSFLLIGLSAAAGGVSGLGSVWLLSLVNAELNRPAGMDAYTGAMLAALCVATLAARGTSDILANLVGQNIVAELRLWLARRVFGAPVAALENYRSHRLLPVLTHDVDVISDLAFVAAPLAISLLVTLGCFVWLALLSPPLCLAVAIALTLGAVVQYIARQKGIAGFEASRAAEDELHRAYGDMIGGARELKINRSRRVRVYRDQIETPVNRIRAINTRAVIIFVVANAFGAGLVFLLIALVLASRSVLGLDAETQSGFVLALLFLRGPVEQIMAVLPTIARAQVALARIGELRSAFDSIVPDADVSDDAPAASISRQSPRITFRKVEYVYPANAEGRPFGLGPVDFTFEPGQITFVIGDNGSGKTTLAKLLLGLYAPVRGVVEADGVAITDQTRDAYRQIFSTVLSDFHLFEDLPPGHALSEDDCSRHLDRLGLNGKVSVKDGRLTTTDLSAGQRKRLALLHVWSEARPVLVLDEWAADQDPGFRRMFYEELLPELKRQGKTLIVISHDDRYFHIADHILHIEAAMAD
ncbi:cyclic peptide export ABC transporter [Rhizobium sp. FKL33]|uniref:cyclic peptide export ABC transporter n=1 Tax=Rhizobium sp. FKL33 TaxID=2562307 RepID=UPI00197E0758|nr:cyclic peptide export ABC transporter [Rhizobium sp. FKL33]